MEMVGDKHQKRHSLCECWLRPFNDCNYSNHLVDFRWTSPISTIDIGGASGPLDLVKNNNFMAGGLYFPLGEGSYMMELNIKYYLFVSDANGIVDWESMFDSGHQQKYVLDTYTGMSSDPSEWPVDGKIYTPMPTARPTSRRRCWRRPTSPSWSSPSTWGR